MNTPFTTWTSRYIQVLESYDAARARALANPNDEVLEADRIERLADAIALERDMATDFIVCLRKSNQWSGEALRILLSEIVKDAVAGVLDELRTDVQDLAAAVAALERPRNRKAVAA